MQLLAGWAVFLALGASIYLGPYFAAWRIREAVAAGDSEALRDFVDFEAVRENLKAELRRTVEASRRARDREESEEPADAGPEEEEEEAELDLGSQLAVAVGETMIDRFATPEGVDRALRDPPEEGSGWSSFLGLGAGDGGEEEEGGGVSVRAGYDGWSDFTVRLGVDRDASDGEPLWADILFERRGIWTWRVTGARVSPDAIPLLTR